MQALCTLTSNQNAYSYGLFVVIGFALDDGTSAIDLLGEDEAYHLMGECHF